ncbi:patatin-like phospholipase family protein [Arhodomonas sp. SL1]|uniref:patatin-like phospholipase family protein n=1 Tax=Arhodomonas sp. SL1 TaxID=3425691 RepID=UPI003F8846D7
MAGINPHFERIALVLQGGGALGAYHQGVFDALAQAGPDIDWFAGTSIGAIQAAILAGNPPERRVAALEAFWRRISWPQTLPAPPPEHPWRKSINIASAMGTMLWGQPNFFTPRPGGAWLSPMMSGEVGHYDLSGLEQTLSELIDFERLNEGPARLSLGAVEVETGRQVYFDNRERRLDLRHVMASGALPPAFPAVPIGDYSYWDGGLLSNTPLDAVLDANPRRDTLCFLVDLFDPAGRTPEDLDQLEDRRKDIIYASRSRAQVDHHRQLHALRHAVGELYRALPPERRRDPELKELSKLGCTTTMYLVHLIYRGQAYRSWAKDFTFLPQTLADHRACGQRDARHMLAERPWEQPVPEHEGVVLYEIDNRVPAPGTASERASG